MANTKTAHFETDALKKARAEYVDIIAQRKEIERELALLRQMSETTQNEDRRSELLMKYEVVKGTQEEMKETLRLESDRAFSAQARNAETRLEALECLYRVVNRYLCYKKGVNGPVDDHKLDQYWAAVIFTTNEVARFNKAGDES
jgi:hypothetical protein